MELNRESNLYLSDIYSYDISSCHYNILKRLGYNVSSLSEEKLERNTQIGLMMRENPRLTNIVRSITNSTIDKYLLKNGLEETDLIIRQYDGFLTPKMLHVINLDGLPLDLRSCYQSFLVSVDRKWYLAYDGNKVEIKGIPYRYKAMDLIYERLIKINFGSKKAIFNTLQKIKDYIYYSEDAYLYCIPNDDKTSFTVFLKKYGEVEISPSMINIMDTDDIDRERYFEFYLRPFTESIVLEFI